MPERVLPPAAVIVAESFGIQFCAVVIDDVSLTVKHSFVPLEPPNSAYGPAVKFVSPGHSARKQ